VTLTEDSAASYSRRLGFRIVGTLRVYPRPPESTFDTWLEVASQHYEVRSGF
jgi:predicted component of type VI protein secretion system